MFNNLLRRSRTRQVTRRFHRARYGGCPAVGRAPNLNTVASSIQTTFLWTSPLRCGATLKRVAHPTKQNLNGSGAVSSNSPYDESCVVVHLRHCRSRHHHNHHQQHHHTRKHARTRTHVSIKWFAPRGMAAGYRCHRRVVPGCVDDTPAAVHLELTRHGIGGYIDMAHLQQCRIC